MKTFRLFALFLCATLCAGFASCDDDEDEKKGSSSKLIGTWELVSSEGWEKVDGEIVDSWMDDDDDIRLVFDKDGTFTAYEWYGSGGGEWDFEDSGEWEYEGDKLYLYEDYGDVEKVTVKTLTSSRLVIEYHGEYHEYGYEYEEYELSTFRKIK